MKCWTSANVKTTNIDVQMECAFQSNIGSMVIMIVRTGPTRQGYIAVQDLTAFLRLPSLVMSMYVFIINGRAAMVSSHSDLV